MNEIKKSESLGILLILISVLAFNVMGGLIKYLDGSIPLPELVFFRSFIALAPLILFLMWTGDFPSGLKTKQPLKHIIRCLLGTFAMFCTFKVLELLPIAEATTLKYLSPIFLVMLAILFLKEQVSAKRWLGVGLGLSGLLLMTLPNFSLLPESNHNTLLGIALGVLGALCTAGARLQIRQLTQMGENAGAIAFYFAITSSAVGLLGMIGMMGEFQSPKLWQWVCLIAIGLIGGLAQITMTLAFKYAQASVLAPFDYFGIVCSVIIGFVVFAELPSLSFWLAMPLILLGAFVAKSNR